MEERIYTSAKEVRNDFAGIGRGLSQTKTSKIKSNGIKIDIVALKYLLGCTYNLEDILKNDIREIRCRSNVTRTEIILRPNGTSDQEEVVRLIVKRETSWKKGEEIVALLQSSNGIEVRLKNLSLD